VFTKIQEFPLVILRLRLVLEDQNKSWLQKPVRPIQVVSLSHPRSKNWSEKCLFTIYAG